jgi:hypothetical protein
VINKFRLIKERIKDVRQKYINIKNFIFSWEGHKNMVDPGLKICKYSPGQWRNWEKT